jgi:DNA-binding PadR family transcriptional regulator
MERPSERLRRKVLVENLWFFVLKIISKKPTYGFLIRDSMKDNFGFWLGNVTSYKVLYALEKDGYVSSYKQGNKRIYRITQKGKNELIAAKKFIHGVAR